MNEIASRYATALFSIAKESNKVESLQLETKTLSSLLLENKEFKEVLASTFISLKEKEEMLDKVLASFDKDLLAFSKVIVSNNRARLFDDILVSFNSLCNEYRGVLEGLVYSISPLEKEVKQNLEKKISEIEHVKVELYNKVDPLLIGGVKIVIKDKVYDGSIKTKLEMMKEAFKKKED